LAHYANFTISKDMMLHYTQFPEGPETTVFTLRGDGKFRQLFRMKLHFELDLNDLPAAVKRINNLLIFS
jgi:hypothetical protein